MKRIDLYKAQLKAALAEYKIRVKQYNAAKKSLHNTYLLIEKLEEKIATILAKAE